MKQNKITQLNNKLIDRLMSDLDDPDKCTPGLYQVVRGIITDNQEFVDRVDSDALDKAVGSVDLPFKFNV